MRITIIGAGYVGATTAKLIADKEPCNELVPLNILESIPKEKIGIFYNPANVKTNISKLSI